MSAPVFAFVGSKGGCGTSTLCARVAQELAQSGNVLLVDGDLSGRRSIAILLDGLRQLDAARAEHGGISTARVAGVTIAELASSYESAFTLTFADVERLAATSDEYPTVVVDLSQPFSAAVRPFVVRSTRFVVVCEASVLGVMAVRSLLDELARFGIPKNRIVLLLNRRGSDAAFASSKQVEEALGMRVFAELPPLADRAYARSIATFAKGLSVIASEPELVSLLPSAKGVVLDRRLSSRPASTHGVVVPLTTSRAAASPSGQAERDRLKLHIHESLSKTIDLVDASKAQGDAAKRAELRARVTEATLAFLAQQPDLTAEDVASIKDEVVNEALGFGPLEDLMKDPDVTEIMVNGARHIYVERRGLIERTPKAFVNDGQVRLVIDRIIAPLGRRIDEASPMVDARLPDGSRVNAIIEPLSIDGPTLTIRRFGTRRLTDADLVATGSTNEPTLAFLRACIEARLNVVISGGTGSGKTTFLNVLSGYLPRRERIVTIEDAAELFLNQPHVVRLESRPPNIEGRGEVTIRDLVRNALRMRPDRIVVGECRSAEAIDMLQAMNTGHDGSLTTIHANSPRDSLARIETMVLMSGFDLPVRAIREQVASALDIIIHTARLRDGSRKVVSVTEVVGMEGDVVTTQEIIRFSQHGVDSENRVIGSFEYTGVQPQCLKRFAEYGVVYDARELSTLPAAVASW